MPDPAVSAVVGAQRLWETLPSPEHAAADHCRASHSLEEEVPNRPQEAPVALGCLCPAELWLLPPSHQNLLKTEPSAAARDKNIIHVQVWLRHLFLAGFAPRFSHSRTDQLERLEALVMYTEKVKNPNVMNPTCPHNDTGMSSPLAKAHKVGPAPWGEEMPSCTTTPEVRVHKQKIQVQNEA